MKRDLSWLSRHCSPGYYRTAKPFSIRLDGRSWAGATDGIGAILVARKPGLGAAHPRTRAALIDIFGRTPGLAKRVRLSDLKKWAKVGRVPYYGPLPSLLFGSVVDRVRLRRLLANVTAETVAVSTRRDGVVFVIGEHWRVALMNMLCEPKGPAFP